MVIGSDNSKLEQFGVRPGAVIFTCAAFFFAILLAQNALRDELKWYGIAYMETLHVITYFAILFVSLNAVILVAFPNLGFLRRDNVWIEAFYCASHRGHSSADHPENSLAFRRSLAAFSRFGPA